MKHDIHVRRVWPMAPTAHARWEGGARAVLAVTAYEFTDDGHVCVPSIAEAEVTVPRDNVISITTRKEDTF